MLADLQKFHTIMALLQRDIKAAKITASVYENSGAMTRDIPLLGVVSWAVECAYHQDDFENEWYCYEFTLVEGDVVLRTDDAAAFLLGIHQRYFTGTFHAEAHETNADATGAFRTLAAKAKKVYHRGWHDAQRRMILRKD